ncbi:hypothetical protein OMAG_001975 [Candidatus Omnitrophus magneticus]|uniref:Uncharacterized protein n=1 Tax=Candidatus Omnitrophus magneticus TaxID=1609969 RepID=A0A0F0CLH4_9BACT|nr:hypothetical protein OMAG_001975 [Candidatus Omnitrophus magneticus]
MDVEVSLAGGTLGIFYPMKGLLDASMSISNDSWEKISNVILIASRVALSTDANIKFYCVITQDERLPEMQVIIIKYVEDVRRGMYRDISRDEAFKRTLFSMNLTPQAKKERTIEKVFDKLGLEEGTREDVMEEFFRSPPSKLKDIGFWKGHFYLKDISEGEFLAAQMAHRMRIDFREKKELSSNYDFRGAEGDFLVTKTQKYFLVTFKIFEQSENNEEILKLRRKKIWEILRIANEVVEGYEFKNFDFVSLSDEAKEITLWMNSYDVYDFHKKQSLPVEQLVKASGEYF